MNLWGIQGWSGKQNHKVKVWSHCEVKKSPELYSKTFKPSKTKDLLPVSMKRPWGMGIAYSFLSLCRQSIGFKLFLADRKEEIPDKIKFIPIVPHPHHTLLWGVRLPSPLWQPHWHWRGREMPQPLLKGDSSSFGQQWTCHGLSTSFLYWGPQIDHSI